jgi:hypothetical protein
MKIFNKKELSKTTLTLLIGKTALSQTAKQELQ